LCLRARVLVRGELCKRLHKLKGLGVITHKIAKCHIVPSIHTLQEATTILLLNSLQLFGYTQQRRTHDSAERSHTRTPRPREPPVPTMDTPGVANLVLDDDIRHDTTRDGHHDDTFPLLDRLLEDLPEVVERFVLPGLDPTALALLARVGRGWRAVVVSSGLPRAPGITEGWPLRVTQFCGSIERLAWAKANGCPWIEETCALTARGGHLDVLRWAREHHCPWDGRTCAFAAKGGHLDVLQWAREHHCPWHEGTCEYAAVGGHLDVLRWAREHHCPWTEWTCRSAAEGGHLDVLQWAREHHCPWDEWTCEYAARGGHLDVLRWAREHHCPWDESTCAFAAAGGHLDVLRWAREHHCP